MDKWMVLTYWNFDIDKELREFKASSVVEGGTVTEQEYGTAELVGGEVSAVDTVNALPSAHIHPDPFCYFSVSPFQASVCFASKSSHLCLFRGLPLAYRGHLDKTCRVLKMLGN